MILSAASLIFGADGPFSIDVDSFATSLAINTVSAYAAVQAAHSLLPSLKENNEKLAFLYTGNGLNQVVIPAIYAWSWQVGGVACH